MFAGLDADTSYDLQALVNDDTNLTSVVSFTTDGEGNASIDSSRIKGKITITDTDTVMAMPTATTSTGM